MMQLAALDIATIVLTCFACTVVVAAFAMLLLRLLRSRPLFARLLVVSISAIVAVAASVLAISIEMYLSEHDFSVLIWVLAFAAVFGCLAAWVLARSVRGSMQSLAEEAQRIGAVSQRATDTDALATESVQSEGASDEFTALSRELAEVSQRVRMARAELEELDSARRRFFAWISHDLRTPLAAVRAIAEAAESSNNAETRELAHGIGAQAVTMTRLVDDLSELSQLSSGHLTLHPELLELRDIVSDNVADMHAAAEQRNVSIVAAGIEGHMVWADPHRLGRIITNLLSNAIRHSPEGSTVLITATELDDRLVLGILDQGSGVATADLDRMFEVGWRDDLARAKPDGDIVASSAGLGLAIARGLARAHGGDLSAERTDTGFRMNLRLPIAEGLERASAAAQ